MSSAGSGPGIYGIGVDSVEHERVARALRAPGFGARVFTPDELALPLPSIAARWAAREAVVKALRGLHGMRLRDFPVCRAAAQPPEFQLAADTRARLAALGVGRLHLSLTHDRTRATAFVIAEGVAS